MILVRKRHVEGEFDLFLFVLVTPSRLFELLDLIVPREISGTDSPFQRKMVFSNRRRTQIVFHLDFYLGCVSHIVVVSV
jgi:hypothetical protein